MRKTLGVLALGALGLVLFTPVFAQVSSDIATERAQLQSDRQAVVAANLPLSEEQAKAFWPVYREYRAEMQKLGDGMVALIVDYAKNQLTMTDAQATAMLDRYLSIQKEEARIKAAWAPKFRKALPPKDVTRFYQIENKLDAMLRYEAAEQIPLVETGKS